MYKKLVIICLFPLLFVACGSLTPDVEQTVPLRSNQKAFAKEDMYIIFALRAEQIGDRKSASELFNILYEKSAKKEYLYRSLENDLVRKANKEVIQRVDALTQGSLEDHKLIRYKVVALVAEQKILEAQNLGLQLIQSSPEIDDYILVSDIYVQRKEFETALKYLESAYIKNYSEEVLDRMAIVLYVNLHKTKEAIAQLETHTRVHGCSERICNRLIGFYSNENNIDGLLSTYLRLYSLTNKKAIAKKIVQIYGYKKEYLKLIDFLEHSYKDEDTLLQLYSVTRNYKKAYPLANKLYEQTRDLHYLGQSAIYEYESQEKSFDKQVLTSVIEKLQRVTQEDKSPIYLNYLGYILIDHDVDVKKGMEYIHEVLKVQPNSSFYLDSLAWGYYKMGNCKKAKDVMNKVMTLEGSDEAEVLLHLQKINQCIKN